MRSNSLDERKKEEPLGDGVVDVAENAVHDVDGDDAGAASERKERGERGADARDDAALDVEVVGGGVEESAREKDVVGRREIVLR